MAVELSQEFRDFLIESNQHGYGTEWGKEHVKVLPSGEHELVYDEHDGWLFTDRWIGGEPFSGHAHVSVRHPDDPGLWLPIWGLAYNGGIQDEKLTPDGLGAVLGEVLPRPEPSFPIRGPFTHAVGSLEYRFRKLSGTLERFNAEETIAPPGMVLGRHALYSAYFTGTLANRQPELETRPVPWLKRGKGEK